MGCLFSHEFHSLMSSPKSHRQFRRFLTAAVQRQIGLLPENEGCLLFTDVFVIVCASSGGTCFEAGYSLLAHPCGQMVPRRHGGSWS